MQSAQDYKNGEQYQECVDKAKQILKTEPNVFHYVIKAKSFICHCNSKVSLIFHFGILTKLCGTVNNDSSTKI